MTMMVFSPNWLGDAVMALPAVSDIRRHQPARRLVVAARPGVAGLWTIVAGVDEVVVIPRARGAARWRTLGENAGALRQDWPRIPLPDSKGLLLASAELGRKVADLLDPETEVGGVTGGNVRPELRVIGVPTRSDGRPLNAQAGDMAVTAGWGHAGRGASPCRAKERSTPDLGQKKSGRPSGKGLRPWASAQSRRWLSWGSRRWTSI